MEESGRDGQVREKRLGRQPERAEAAQDVELPLTDCAIGTRSGKKWKNESGQGCTTISTTTISTAAANIFLRR